MRWRCSELASYQTWQPQRNRRAKPISSGGRPMAVAAFDSYRGSGRAFLVNRIALPNGSVEVVSRSDAMRCEHWTNVLGSEAKDRRYYELVEDTIHEEFDDNYFAVRDQTGEICAIQPFFVLHLAFLTGAKPLFGRLTNFIRRLWPGFMRARTLMVGCAAGEGHLDGEDEFAERFSARLLASVLVQKARELKARLVVLKEF